MVLHLDSHVLVFRVLINFIPFCYVFGPYGPIHIEVSTFNGLVLHLGWLSPSSSLTWGDFLHFYKACGFKPPWDYVALGLLEALYLLTHSSFMYIVIHLHSQLVMAIQSKFFDPTQKIPNLNSIFLTWKLHLGWLSPSSSLTLGDFLRFYKACGFKPPCDYVALGLLEALYLLTLSSFMYIVIHLHFPLDMAIRVKIFWPDPKNT